MNTTSSETTSLPHHHHHNHHHHQHHQPFRPSQMMSIKIKNESAGAGGNDCSNNTGTITTVIPIINAAAAVEQPSSSSSNDKPSTSAVASTTVTNISPSTSALISSSAHSNSLPKFVKNSINSQSQASLKINSSANNLLVNGVAATSGLAICTGQQISIDETPTKLVYKRIEWLIEKMQDEMSGVTIRTVKNFMAKIPSVCTGSDIIQWILKKVDGVEDAVEALHFAHLVSSHGYVFPIDDHILTVKNDGTFYRFQTPYYWPSNNAERDNTDYAVYLCKRTMQNKTRLELADYEAENLAKLQKLLSKKWEFIYMQAEAQIKVDKKRDKQERKILDSQERAFWDVYRPAPGCLNTTEEDIKKTMRTRRVDFPNIGFFRHAKQSTANKTGGICGGAQSTITVLSSAHSTTTTTTTTTTLLPPPANSSGGAVSNLLTARLAENDEFITIENLKKEKDFLKRRLERRYVKTSKVSESYTNYFELYIEFDPFITPPDPANPWISDSTELWETERSLKDIPQRRVRRWGFSIHELLKDQSGRELFRRFLEREFSSENLRFYEVCNRLRYSTNKDIANKVNDIYNEFLAPYASCPINIDSRIMAITKMKMENPDRYTYDEAREHIFNLMTRDSYNRFLRSDAYKESLASAKKKIEMSENMLSYHVKDFDQEEYLST